MTEPKISQLTNDNSFNATGFNVNSYNAILLLLCMVALVEWIKAHSLYCGGSRCVASTTVDRFNVAAKNGD